MPSHSSSRITQIGNHLVNSTETNSSSKMSSRMLQVPLSPPDPILNLTTLYKNDTDKEKINLGVGAYRDIHGKPVVLPVVRKASEEIIADPALDHEYLPIDGLASFTSASARLILGESSPAISENRVTSCQTISGSGAVRIGAAFVERFKSYVTGISSDNKPIILISNPTWGNHKAIFSDAGLECIDYPYWKASTKSLDLEGMLNALKKAPKGSAVCLHACAHNPTGLDPTIEEWKQIAEVIKEVGLFPFFDCAYQGFASGDLDKDASAVRLFVDLGLEMIVCQSFSKNMGLYSERAGCLNVITKDSQTAINVGSQLKTIQRAMLSSPPAFGARVASKILNSPALYEQWKVELKEMADRIISLREDVRNGLIKLNTPGNWDHIVTQIGMFSFTGLSTKQTEVLINKFHIYLTSNGRISMAGLNPSNVEYFCKAVDWTVRNVQ